MSMIVLTTVAQASGVEALRLPKKPETPTSGSWTLIQTRRTTCGHGGQGQLEIERDGEGWGDGRRKAHAPGTGSSTSHRPEEIRILAQARVPKLSVRRHEFVLQHVCSRPPSVP